MFLRWRLAYYLFTLLYFIIYVFKGDNEENKDQ